MEENKDLLEAVQDEEEVDQISNEVAGEYPTVEEATEIIEGPSEDITKTDIEVTDNEEVADNTSGTEEVVEEASEKVAEEVAEEESEDSEPEAEESVEEVSDEVIEESQLDRIEKLLNEVLRRLGYSEEEEFGLEDKIDIVDEVNEDNSALLSILDKLDEEGGNDYE